MKAAGQTSKRNAAVEVGRLLSRAQEQQQRGGLASASKHLRKAIKINPADQRAYLLLARIQQQQGQNQEAMRTYQACLRQQPEVFEALLNLGMLYKRHARLDDALACYDKALKLRSDVPELHNNMGNAWLERGDPGQAAAAYRRAIDARPAFAGAWHNLGRLLLQQNDAVAALEPLRRARQLQPESWQIHSDLADCLVHLPPASYAELPAADLLDCLQLQRIDGRTLNRMACRYLATQIFYDALDLLQRDQLSVDEALLDRLQQPLLLNLLQREPLCDWSLEQLLTRVRQQLLLTPELLDEKYLPLVAALAEQCFLNEYLWPVSAAEQSRLEALAGRPIAETPAIELCLYACYRPLSQRLSIDDAMPPQAATGDPSLACVWQQQVVEPAQEDEYRSQLPALTTIDDGTSTDVRAQYEANPYPRWRMLDQPDGYSLGNYLCLLFPHLRARPPGFDPAPAILCAGCGTGLQALRMARRIPDAQITAIDMSRTSLAYGMRQAAAHGHDDIDFAQADIVRLDDSVGPFDAIECYGVLHHLADPQAGWQALRRRLNPGGVMRIGLYSHAARGPIRAIRERIAAQNIDADIVGIRRVREYIAALDAGDPLRGLLHSPDFYSVSECRDLMFHVQEHQLDLSAIAEIIDELALEFLGFEFDDYATLQHYRQQYPDDPNAINLQYWQAYEQAHPDSFAAQYIFWVRAPD
ncbi:Tfp pilus assembly protein PilF/2-polyprenyl-3-methyl-5-hydroxy-6-metoxy-1,4-benzoquinol methylase [Methylohalomonas lacus]|uniref:Tfp pilus assembly protein PilF/2-polyprenyl-3-methyl-5-hydroxy-6-metoxy-1, 4-benzoquinol methylase n=1 Tax=Methylohalomonas lacus TaxID=398773 RepID=A0AAE3L4U5_9GAMM|nr:class I SAM-dependent methyltransferase [Methylohalomonas lacus]MCS3904493.1 Tfp pilus assembly protein PilF/2-polyprenyl-3-methyl-5-hydroxy-6-metoxy-1,4-benzoquinol methylase [Methylohalomonas lacus]